MNAVQMSRTGYYSPDKAGTVDELVVRHAPLVQRIAYHLSARLPSSVMLDDLIQAGMMGLLDATQLYDPSQGASFETYASIRIRGSMLDELRRNDWAPKSLHRKERDVVAAMQKIETETGRSARAQEIADALDISLEEYHSILQDSSTCRVLNFGDLSQDQDILNDSIPTASTGPLDGLQNDEFRQILAESIAELPEREKLIISLYYDDELNLKEIGCVLGVSESRVSQLLSQAHMRLRKNMRSLQMI